MYIIYRTTQLEKRLNQHAKFGLLMMLGSIIYWLTNNYLQPNFFVVVGTLIDSIIIMILGLQITVFSRRKLKHAKKDYIEIDEDKLGFSSRGSQARLSKLEIESLEIKVSTVEVKDIHSNSYNIYLGDFGDFQTQKALKSDLEHFKKNKPNKVQAPRSLRSLYRLH